MDEIISNFKIEDLNPKNNGKYNTYIYKFLKKNKLKVEGVGWPRIFKFLGRPYIGWFGDGNLIGSFIHSGNEDVEIYCFPGITAENIGIEIPFSEYLRIGNCAIYNNRHDWDFSKNFRRCKYCGKVQRKSVKTIKTIERIVQYDDVKPLKER